MSPTYFTVCPKCTDARARYVLNQHAREVRIVCRCGLDRVVFSEHGDVTTEHRERFDPRQLPSPTSVLARYFDAIVQVWPETINTADLAGRVPGGRVKSASHALSVLSHKRLVDRVITRRGKRGGSYWRVSESARAYLQLPPRNPDP